MKINKIKELLKNSKGENKINTLIAITKLIESYRSIFVGSQCSELTSVEYDLLKSFMLESLDFSLNENNEIEKYFCIPIIIDETLSNVSDFKLPKHQSEIQSAYVNHMINSPESCSELLMGNYIVSRRTLFGGNIFNTFDTVRALTSDDNGYLTDDVVLNECDDEHLFYLVGKYSFSVSDPFINDDAYEDFLGELNLHQYFPLSNLSVGKPQSLSKEYGNSMLCDVATRLEQILVGDLGFDGSVSEDDSGLSFETVKLKLDESLLSGHVELYSADSKAPFVIIDLARIPDINQKAIFKLVMGIMYALAAYRFKYFKYSVVNDNGVEQCKFIRPYDKKIKNKIMQVI